MKISLEWLKDYVELPTDLSIETIAHGLTMATVEVEGVEKQAAGFDAMRVGRINEVKSHPNADRLRVTVVDLGEAGTQEIVCGGTNLQEGMLVAVAEPGAKVRWHGEGDLVELKVTKIRGVKSYGMICASEEIGLGDLFPSHSEFEILDCSFLDCASGTPLAVALDLDDVIFDIDNKSLTNRPDLWGHYGMARELSAIFNCRLKPLPEVVVPNSASEELKVRIEDTDLCYRYIGAIIKGVQVTESPFWMKRRLAAVGQRSINLPVDLTNYVLFALGQPLHAFDQRDISQQTIVVRPARSDERLELLDDSLLALTESDLVIADSVAPVALAGVMGGKRTGVHPDTKALVLEAATFKGVHVRRTALRHGVRTEASSRFEKGLDTSRAELGEKLFLHHLLQLQPHAEVVAWVDEYPMVPQPVRIETTCQFINDRAGQTFKTEEIVDILRRLQFEVTCDGDQLLARVPSWRATGDVSIPEDLVEEVTRIHGYDDLVFQAPQVELRQAVHQPFYLLKRRLREYLAYRAGLTEVVTYPWDEEQLLIAAGYDPAQTLQLADPPANNLRCLQCSLVPGLLGAVAKNYRNYDEFGVFELGRVFYKDEKSQEACANEILPNQPWHIAGAVVGYDERQVFLRTKGIVEGLLGNAQIEPTVIVTTEQPAPWVGQGLAVKFGCQQIGALGLATPRVLRMSDIEKCVVGLFEINVSNLKPLSALHYEYNSLPRYPQVHFDLALLFDESVTWEQIVGLVRQESLLVQHVCFVDEYRGQQIPAGKKSIALQMTLGDPKATLTGEQIQRTADAVIDRLSNELGGQLRR